MGPTIFLRRLGRIVPRSNPDSSDAELRDRMVREQIESRGIRDPRVLNALRRVPREEFVPKEARRAAHGDHALPIGEEQTISQPYMVALMTEKLRVEPDHRVLEIGTGSGYQTAVLAHLAREVFTIEIVPELAARAASRFAELGLTNVHARSGNGYEGWPEHAPFPRIIVTAAPPEVPAALVAQLAEDGLMVVPVGTTFQEIAIVRKTASGITQRHTLPVRFVPMIDGAS